MGYYVNPPNESNVSFLLRVGAKVSIGAKWKDVPHGSLPVVLVDNGIFIAAGIAYSEAEYDVFLDDRDPRARAVFIVKIEDLMPVADPGFEQVLMPREM